MKKHIFILMALIFSLHIKGEQIPDGFYKIIPASDTENAITYAGWGAASGEKPFIYKKSGANKWLAKNSSEGIYIEVPGYSLALTAPQDETGTSIIFSNMENAGSTDKNPFSNQIWLPESVGGDKYVLRLKENPNLVATLKEIDSDKFELLISEYVGDNNQQWILDCEQTLEARRQEIEREKEEGGWEVSELVDTSGEKYVDLGLSVKWASYNVGAKTESDPGKFFSWGEIRTKNRYDGSQYRDGEKIRKTDISGDTWSDAATYNLMGKWRMPTEEEGLELVEKCKWEWETVNGQPGYRVTGPNGNSIFLPAAGYKEETSLKMPDTLGAYWTSTRNTKDHENAYIMNFTNDPSVERNHIIWYYPRPTGLPIRGVLGKQKDTVGLSEATGNENGHDYVDLGLSVKWATANVGADSPGDYGNLYAQGETYTKDYYTPGTYKLHSHATIGGGAKYPDDRRGIVTLQNKNYDVATMQWGGDWHVPTAVEMYELKSKCTWEKVKYKGSQGFKVTGPNGNSIFLPLAGRNEASTRDQEQIGYYWTSSLFPGEGFETGNTDKGYALIFNNKGDKFDIEPSEAYQGFSVRPVKGNFRAASKNDGTGITIPVKNLKDTEVTLDTRNGVSDAENGLTVQAHVSKGDHPFGDVNVRVDIYDAETNQVVEYLIFSIPIGGAPGSATTKRLEPGREYYMKLNTAYGTRPIG